MDSKSFSCPVNLGRFINCIIFLSPEVINKITVEELKERVQAMNPIYGEAFFLRYFLELDYTEIADALSISVSAAALVLV